MPQKLMTVAEYAEHRGISARAVRYGLRDGRIRFAKGTRLIDREKADRDWADNTDTRRPRNSVNGNPKGRRSPGRSGHGDSNTAKLAHSNAARAAIKATREQFELERDMGRYVDREEFYKAAFEGNRKARDLLLALPKVCGPIVAKMDDRAACEEVLEREVRRICEELSRTERAS